MKNVKNKIVGFVKGIFFLPINVLSIISEMKRIDNKIDLLNQRFNELDLNFNKEKETSPLLIQELSKITELTISTEITEVFENHFLQIESLLSIYNSLPNLKYLPATRGWAGSPDFLNKIIGK